MEFFEITKSELRRKLLAYFFTNPESNLYLRQIAIILDEDPGNLSKELSRLVKEGVFMVESRGNQKYFILNENYPLFDELESIIFKTVGLEGSLREALKKVAGIKVAFIYGSFAKKEQNGFSDVDLVIIGDINEDELLKRINKLENFLDREINYTLYSQGDWQRMKNKADTFTATIFDEPKIMLTGREDEL